MALETRAVFERYNIVNPGDPRDAAHDIRPMARAIARQIRNTIASRRPSSRSTWRAREQLS